MAICGQSTTSNSKAKFGVQHLQAMAKLELSILKSLKIHNEHGHQNRTTCRSNPE